MSLFEVKVMHLVPAIGRGKMVKTNAIGEDGFEYAVKALTDHQKIPFSEWFCYQLAGAVSLACPGYCTLVLPDGSRAFGSRIQPGLVDMQASMAEGIDPAAFLDGCLDRISVAYALDVFVSNIDRHFGNFLFSTNSLGKRTVMPIDYSHAWLVGGWPIRDITDKRNPTTNHVAILRGLGLWQPGPALLALGTIDAIKSDAVQRWADEAHPSWISDEEKAALVTWWGSDLFHERVSKCVAYCRA